MTAACFGKRNGWILPMALAGMALSQQDYSGPRPPKPDIPFLIHADSLVSTEVTVTKEESRKEGLMYVIPGSSSPVKTPMAEPIFIFSSNKIPANTLELYRLTPSGENREVFGGGKRKKNGARPLRLTVTQVGERLYRVESYESLEPGEYSLSPNGSNQAFCFAVY